MSTKATEITKALHFEMAMRLTAEHDEQLATAILADETGLDPEAASLLIQRAMLLVRMKRILM